MELFRYHTRFALSWSCSQKINSIIFNLQEKHFLVSLAINCQLVLEIIDRYLLSALQRFELDNLIVSAEEFGSNFRIVQLLTRNDLSTAVFTNLVL